MLQTALNQLVLFRQQWALSHCALPAMAILSVGALLILRLPGGPQPSQRAISSTTVVSIQQSSTQESGTTLAAETRFAADESDLPSLTALGSTRRGPIDVTWLPRVNRAVVLNQASQSLSLIDLQQSQVLAETPCGAEPSQIIRATAAWSALDDRSLPANVSRRESELVAVTATGEDQVQLYAVTAERVVQVAEFPLPLRPFSLALHPDGRRLYVSRQAAHDVIELDLSSGDWTTVATTSRLPGHIGYSAVHRSLVVATPADRGVALIDLEQRKVIHVDRFAGINFGHFALTADGQHAYFPWMVYRRFSITRNNIQQGWVLASRLARFSLADASRREAMSLDPPGDAVADPWGIALTPHDSHVVISAGGTHELLVLPTDGLPLEARGSTDHLVPAYQNNPERMRRIELGGRPLGIETHPDEDWVLVANELRDSLQVVDWQTGERLQEIRVRDEVELTAAERGRQLFYDADLSLDAWYSCHSCHQEGGTSVMTMDTANDGSFGSFKTVLPLYDLMETGPWTWHGWQTDAHAAMKKSVRETMRGDEVREQDAADLLAFFAELPTPRSPYADPQDAEQRAALERGREIFSGDLGGCANCHSGQHRTDGLIHEVGLEKPEDEYVGYNTPALKALWQKHRYLHDGSARSLKEVLTKYHRPAELEAARPLTEQELADLIQYLLTL